VGSTQVRVRIQQCGVCTSEIDLDDLSESSFLLGIYGRACASPNVGRSCRPCCPRNSTIARKQTGVCPRACLEDKRRRAVRYATGWKVMIESQETSVTYRRVPAISDLMR
jgi:hypothetical protein